MKISIGFATIVYLLLSLQANAEITDERMKYGFERGCSLVEVKVLSVQDVPKKYVTLPYYGMEIVKPLVEGDYEPDELRGAQFSIRGLISLNERKQEKLKQGSTYVLFIRQVSRHKYTWGCMEDFVEIVDAESLEHLRQKAVEIYDTTDIKKFRDSPIEEQPDIPSLPDSLLNQLRLFRENPDSRMEYVKQIVRSPLRSRNEGFGSLADSEIQSTTNIPLYHISEWRIVYPQAPAYPIYINPEIPLSRSQVLFLFGTPTTKAGKEYRWLCPKNATTEESGDLVVYFNERMKTKRVFYEKSHNFDIP